MQIILFCPCCFSSEDGGSWGGQAFESGCANCGNGSTINIPRWSVESIREQASWVGKRYYPNQEDKEACEERRRLIDLVKDFPGRTAEGTDYLEWNVTQKLLKFPYTSASVMVSVTGAETAADAIEKTKYDLPYVP